MNRVSQLFISTLIAGATLLQLSCGDATADSKEKTSPGDGSKPEAKASAPVQPSKPVIKTEEEWKKSLTPEQFEILRKHGIGPESFLRQKTEDKEEEQKKA